MAIRAGGAEDTMKGLKSYTEAKLLWITRLADVFIPVFFALAAVLVYNPTTAFHDEGWLYVALAAASLLTVNIFHNLDLYTIPALGNLQRQLGCILLGWSAVIGLLLLAAFAVK